MTKILLMKNRLPDPYWNPYIAGVGIGILIILSFVVTGRGLGAIGAFNGILASVVHAIAPDYALSNQVYSGYVSGVDHPLKDWVVIVILAVPVLVRLYMLAKQIANWRFVILGFVALAVGTVMSLKKPGTIVETEQIDQS